MMCFPPRADLRRRYENAQDYFNYLDGVIDALNGDPQGRFEAFYSTPAQYIEARMKNVPKMPVMTGDMFPYNDDTQGHNMWAGYFTSRPAFKGFVRDSSSLLQSARQLQALSGGAVDLSPSHGLYKLERALGVCQHHDSIA